MRYTLHEIFYSSYRPCHSDIHTGVYGHALELSSEYRVGVLSCWKSGLFGMAGMSSAGDMHIPKCTVQAWRDEENELKEAPAALGSDGT